MAVHEVSGEAVHRIGTVHAFPPQRSRPAAFAAGLDVALAALGGDITAVALDADSESVNAFDALIVHHALGRDGAMVPGVVELLQRTDVPAIVVLHSLPEHPTAEQRTVVESVGGLARALVVNTHAAGDLLVGEYRQDISNVVVMPVGADVAPDRRERPHDANARLRVLTWGMLRPGKGIEHAIRAIALLEDRRREVGYLVAGPSHLQPSTATGDVYRESLARAAWKTRTAGSVKIDGMRRSPEVLAELVRSASVVIVPDDPSDDVASSVLAASIGAGRPVIATAFPHAVELLADGAGVVVPHGDAVALAKALGDVLDDPARLAAMAERAAQLAPQHAWPAVAGHYRELCARLAGTRAPVPAGG